MGASKELSDPQWEWVKPRLEKRFESLAGLLSLPSQNRMEIRRELHRLAGTLGCFGLSEAGRIARRMEEAFLTGEPTPTLRPLLEHLRAKTEEGPSRNLSSSTFAKVAVFSKVELPTTDLIGMGKAYQVQLTPLDDLGGLLGERWDAIVLDQEHPIALDFPAELDIPLLCLVDGETLDDRLKAVNAGARLTCLRDDHPRAILSSLARMIEQSRARPHRILVLDDDELINRFLAETLTNAGYVVETTKTSEEFGRTLEIFAPDLVLLDLTLPDINGDQLCRILRADSRWSEIPVIFLSASTSKEAALRAYEAGADDFLTKPLDEQLLLGRLSSHWRRRSEFQKSLLDDLTGLANRKLGTREIERMISLARRQKSSFSFAILDIDHFKKVNDVHGHFLGDRVLERFGSLIRSTFREEDVLCRWGGEEFVIGLFDCPAEEAAVRLRNLMRQLEKVSFNSAVGSFSVTFSGGITTYPEGGDDLGSLYRQADTALYRAKRDGRARVLLQDSAVNEAMPTRCDIILLEDDEDLANMLAKAFQARGFSSRNYRDGLLALDDWLSGNIQPSRVLLVDNEMPGLNGMELLRRLYREDLLSDTRVITVSAQMNEPEIMESLDIGAIDHIPKPFNLGLLLGKVERVLHSNKPKAL